MRKALALAALASAALALTACGDSEPADSSKPISAEQMVEQLTELYPLPNPRDNTNACDTEKDHPNDCEQLISTDPVSVYQLKNKKAAAHWTKTMDGKGDNTAVQAGHLMLFWKAEYPSSQESIDEMTAEAKRLTK